MSLTQEQLSKYERLRTILADMESVVVAYSGGVDSVLLAKVAHDLLGERALSVTARSASLPARELREAEEVASKFGFRHEVVDTDEVADPRYAANPTTRCYFCKSELFTKLEGLQDRLGYQWLAYGENFDDQSAQRPGGVAANERRVRSPLKEAGLTKADIRALARHLGLPVWDKPAFACLSSRFPYGTEITPERLAQVEQAEDCLWELGFRQFRVRYHGPVARIEVDPADMNQVVNQADLITQRFQALGFSYVSMDLLGYRTGSMNEHVAAALGRERSNGE